MRIKCISSGESEISFLLLGPYLSFFSLYSLMAFFAITCFSG